MNSDSSLAFRLRGKCQFELQIFEKAKDDLSTANTISYNDDTYLLVKECDKKLAELKNAQSTPNPQNQNSSNPKIASQTAPPTTPSTFLKGKERLQDWLTPQKFESMKGDDQMLKYLQNEKISKAIAEISRDPTSFKKYQNDAEVSSLLINFSFPIFFFLKNDFILFFSKIGFASFPEFRWVYEIEFLIFQEFFGKLYSCLDITLSN